jgi:hypothetical protein
MRIPDRTELIATSLPGMDSRRFHVFAPPCWKPWRWLTWWKAKRSGTTGRITVNDGERWCEVNVYEVKR